MFDFCGFSSIQNSRSFATHFKKHWKHFDKFKWFLVNLFFFQLTLTFFVSTEKSPLKNLVMTVKSRSCSFAHFFTDLNAVVRLLTIPEMPLQLKMHKTRTERNFIVRSTKSILDQMTNCKWFYKVIQARKCHHTFISSTKCSKRQRVM